MNAKIILSLIGFCSIYAISDARLEDKYDLRFLPIDLQPVKRFVGLWQRRSVDGDVAALPPPDFIDFGINPIPHFGARTLNVTHTYFDRGTVVRTDYGFMPVKNATRRDPRVHTAYLTTSSLGYSMMEQGLVDNGRINYHLKQYLKRSFAVGDNKNAEDLHIDMLERGFSLAGNRMEMTVAARSNRGSDRYTASYSKLIGKL